MAKPLDVFGLSESATWEEIRERYRYLARLHHPDKNGKHEDFLRIQTAYMALKAKHDALGAFDDIFTTIQREHHANRSD